MGRVLRKRQKALGGRNAIDSPSSHCGSSHHVIKESVCNSDIEKNPPEKNPPDSAFGFQQDDRNAPLQPVTSFSLSPDLNTSVALSSGISADISKANIISNSTVIEILLHLLCREREPDQAKREMLVKALGKGIQHWNSFLYIPLHALPGLEDFRNGYLKKFEFLFEEIRSQVHSSKASFIADPRLCPSSGSPLTQLAMVDTYEHHILDDRYSREFTEISLLGKGGFGSVVKAKSRLDGHSYAVKIIIMNKRNNETNQKILREVQALAQLDHPYIVRYHSSWLQMYTLPCQQGSLDRKMQNCRKSGRHRIEKEIKIQELSSSSKLQEIEESSGGIVFEDSSSPKLNASYKEKHCFPSLITKAGKSTDIPEYKFYESKSAIMQKKEQIVDNYSIKIENSFKSHSEKKSSLFFHSKNSVNDLNSDPSTSINTNGISFDVSMAHDKGKDVYDESFSTSVSSSITSHFKNSLILHRKHARETHVALFIQMGLCGDTLANWISRRNAEEATGNQLDSVDLEVCIEVFKQILEAVQYIHSKNIIHRDLKPPNIFFSEDGKLIKIGDFGLARNLQESSVNISRVGGTGEDLSITPFATLTANTCGVGTAMYAAPEVRSSDSYGKKSDMYNLGIILLELIQPFKTGSERVDSIDKLKKHRYLDPEVVNRWPDIASWIMQLTSVDQAKRPSATELLKSVSMHISSKERPRNYTSAGKISTFSPIQNVQYLELNSLKGYTNNCDDVLRLDDLKIALPEGSCSNSDILNSRNSMIDLQLIADIVRENREKDEEIKKLKEENSKLLNMVAFLQEQINQTSS